MKIKYTWKHVDRSEAAEDYATKKLDRVTKYLHKVVSCEVSFQMVHGEITANMNVVGDNSSFNAHNTSKDIYACIDGLEDKIERQLNRFHDKKAAHT